MSKKASFGLVILALSMAQFIMTVDTTIMNVAIPTVVEDLSTTVGAVQAAIALYALVMAAFMLIGSKLGEIHGRLRIFQIGLIIFAIGSGITAIAPSIGVLIFGWSFLEGLGASLMMPNMMALISNIYKGQQRIAALGIVAGVAGAAAALGPIIGGALSTYSTWRWAFAGEVVIAIIILIMSKQIIDNAEKIKEKFDTKGAVLAASGLAVLVLGILQASTYGWIRAIQPFAVGDFEFEPFGLSIVPFIMGLGMLILRSFFKHERKLMTNSQPTLLKVDLLKVIPFRTGLNVVLLTQLVLGGTLFIMPLFLQIVLGYSAMQSGVALLPISIALILFSVLSAKVAKMWPVVKGIRAGQWLIIIGLAVLLGQITDGTTARDLIFPFALIGAGIGLTIPINQNVVLGSVGEGESSQASGLHYTYQQLGMSLGTAVIGSVLLFSLGNGIIRGLEAVPGFNEAVQESGETIQVAGNVEFVSNEQLSDALDQTDASEEEKDILISVNEEARVQALRVSIAAALIVAALGLIPSGRMQESMSEDQA